MNPWAGPALGPGDPAVNPAVTAYRELPFCVAGTRQRNQTVSRSRGTPKEWRKAVEGEGETWQEGLGFGE